MAAAPLLALKDGALGFGGRDLFADVSLAVGRGDRICLLGRNGSGKSTLMKVLAGQQELDRGDRFVQPGTRVAYLDQDPDMASAATVGDWVAAGLPSGAGTHAAEAALDRLGLSPDRPTGPLSGGERRRAALARTLAGDPDVMLLDEPTNHLDLPTIRWLEDMLDGWRGALVLISHDRRFLTRLGRRIAWLDRGRLRTTDRGFAEFEAWRDEVFAAEEAQAHKLDRLLKEETRWLNEGISARRRRNMGRVRALMGLRARKAERVRGDVSVDLAVAEAERGGRLVIEAAGLSKAFGDKVVCRDFSTRVLRGDRVGVIGANGAGKSTLLGLLLGTIPPDAGTVRHGTDLEVAVFDQRRAALDPEATLKQTLCPGGGDTVVVGGRPRHVAGYLKDFLFDTRQMEQPAGSLSGGERNRLLLARLFARPSNLLVLDEPTNDLDMDTLDLLEEVLADYAGTLLLVSHDRDFLDRLVTSVIAVEGGGEVVETAGGWSDHERWAQGRRGEAAPAASRKVEAAPAAPKAKTKLGFKEQRELDGLPARIEALTDEAAALETRMADPGLYARDPDAFARTAAALEAKRAELAAAEDRWLELEALKESLAGG